MSSRNTPLVLWDTCTILSALTKQPPHRWPLIEPYYDDAKKHNLRIVVSTVSMAETRHLKCAITMTGSEQTTTIERFFQNDYIVPYAADAAVCRRAAAIGRDTTLTPMDAIVVATAVMARCKMIHTFDGEAKDRKPGQVKLLDLNKQIRGLDNEPIEICMPDPSHGLLFSGHPPIIR